MVDNIGQHIYEGKFLRDENFFTKEMHLEIREYPPIPNHFPRHIPRHYLYDVTNEVKVGDLYPSVGGKEYFRWGDKLHVVIAYEGGLDIRVAA